MEETIRDAVEWVVPVVEAIAALVVLAGVVRAAVRWVMLQRHLQVRPNDRLRLELGRALALGLEFQLAADLLNTLVVPTFEELGKLGAVAAIRTGLQFFLAKELQEIRREESEAQARSA